MLWHQIEFMIGPCRLYQEFNATAPLYHDMSPHWLCLIATLTFGIFASNTHAHLSPTHQWITFPPVHMGTWMSWIMWKEHTRLSHIACVPYVDQWPHTSRLLLKRGAGKRKAARLSPAVYNIMYTSWSKSPMTYLYIQYVTGIAINFMHSSPTWKLIQFAHKLLRPINSQLIGCTITSKYLLDKFISSVDKILAHVRTALHD